MGLHHPFSGLYLERGGTRNEGRLSLFAHEFSPAVDTLLNGAQGHVHKAPVDVRNLLGELLDAQYHSCLSRFCDHSLAGETREHKVGLVGRAHLVHLARALDGAFSLRRGDERARIRVDVEPSNARQWVGKGLPDQAVRDQRLPPLLRVGELDVEPVARPGNTVVDVIAVHNDLPRRPVGVVVNGFTSIVAVDILVDA